MSSRWRAVPALAWRESRNSRRRLLLFMSSISIGVAALVAIDSYTANVTASISQQSRALLGGDLSITSRTPLARPVDSLLQELKLPTGHLTRFGSMAIVPGHEGTRLVQVRAVSAEVPFYGKIETVPARAYGQLQRGFNALVDPSLLVALGARVGDSLTLGYAHFAIIGTLENVPGDVSVAAAFGPRVYIPLFTVPATKLVVFGSRAEYETLVKIASPRTAGSVLPLLRPTLEASRLRARTVEDTERRLTSAIEQLDRFLGVVGLVALLLGGIGVASAISAYIAEKVDTVAVLRCLGATQRQVLAVYVLEGAVLGLAGAAFGVVLGSIVQLALPHVLGGFIPLDVQVRVDPESALTGLGVGLWVATLFALLPLLALRRISPLQAIRRDAEGLAARRLWRDAPRLLVMAALASSLVLIAVQRAGRLRDGLGMSGGIAAAIVLLALSAALVSWLARRVLREGWPFVVRQGVANLYRPANQTRAVVLSLGFGAFLISTLYLVQANLLSQLHITSQKSAANLAFFDVQPDQRRMVDSLLTVYGDPLLQAVPIVPMRIATVNGESVAQRSRDRQSWALRREYRSSFRDSLISSEKLVAGAWHVPAARASGDTIHDVSLEESVAQELGVKVGDRITWDVQGVRIPTRVSSLREVNWARFEPNFFAIFEPAALTRAPATWVMLTRGRDAMSRARLQHDVVERGPNVSTIDLSLIQEQVGKIMDKVTLAIRFMALFSVATGALVLFGAVASSRRQRLREGVLLKTLGATRAQIARILIAEYAVLGALGSIAGMLLSTLGAWGLMHFVFEAPFALAFTPLLVLASVMMLLTIVIGLLSGREVFRVTAVMALQTA